MSSVLRTGYVKPIFEVLCVSALGGVVVHCTQVSAFVAIPLSCVLLALKFSSVQNNLCSFRRAKCRRNRQQRLQQVQRAHKYRGRPQTTKKLFTMTIPYKRERDVARMRRVCVPLNIMRLLSRSCTCTRTRAKLSYFPIPQKYHVQQHSSNSSGRPHATVPVCVCECATLLPCPRVCTSGNSIVVDT